MTHYNEHDWRPGRRDQHGQDDDFASTDAVDFEPTRPLDPEPRGRASGNANPTREARRMPTTPHTAARGQFLGNPLKGETRSLPAQRPLRTAPGGQREDVVSGADAQPYPRNTRRARPPRFDVPDAQQTVASRALPGIHAGPLPYQQGRARRVPRISRARAALGAIAALLVIFSAVGAVLMRGGRLTAHAAISAPSGISVAWGDSTGLVSWPAVNGATGYRVTLFRTSDNGIMQQFKVPGTQLTADVQGVWYGEHYQVAVQAIDGGGQLGSASVSAVGAAVPISRATYNGFLDQENRPAGAIDPNLWDARIYDTNETHYGVTFVNGQMHYHLVAGSVNGHQTVSTMRARVPVDWTGRTATIHGEVDLKGTFHNWFAAVLSPQATGPDRIIDLTDRGYNSRTMPQLELFDDQDGLHLLYDSGNHATPRDLGHVPNPISLPNVRDDVVWKVSDTQSQVILDGKPALSVTLPSALAFSRGYLTLAAEDYPNATGGVHTPTACDATMAGCNVWHLDNWGFDAASGQQPATAAYYANGCAPYPTTPSGGDFATTPDVECGTASGNGSTTVNVANAANLTGAAVSFEVKNPGSVQVSVNGGAWSAASYIASDINQYAAQDYVVNIPASSLRNGANTVSYQLGGGAKAFNTEIETISSTPYVAPAEPPEPAPLGTWGGHTQPTATATASSTSATTATVTSTSTATATGATTSYPMNNTPCTVTINGQSVSGTCTGTFTLASGMGTPSPTATATSTGTATPTSTVTATATPTSSPTPVPSNGGRQAGINVAPSMRPWRYSGANPDGWWCVAPNCSQNANPMTTINAELAMAQQLGVAVVRMEFPWALIETGNGVYDWSRADAIVNAANAHGVQLQPILVYTPAWINRDPTQSPTASEFSAFVTAIVGRYHNSIHYWEMWNEPDHYHYWNAGEQAYVSNILVPGYAATKAADPSAKVIIGAPSWANNGWLNSVYSMGGGNSFDIMAWHDYSGGGQVLADAQSVQNVLNAHGQSNKPLWLGEYGVQEQSTSDTQQQALMRQVLQAQNSPIAMAIWYNLRDDNSMTCCPPSVVVAANWGLVAHDDATFKQGFNVLKQLIAGGLPKPS